MLAVEQSVEMPLDAIDDPAVLTDIVGQVEDIADQGDGRFLVRLGLAMATTGLEAGQFLNMLFGNSSIHDDITLADITLPPAMTRAFGGSILGVPFMRRRTGAQVRALTGSALKPQGLAPEALGDLARRLAEGGIDTLKDDHGLADQEYSPFARRVAAVAAAVRAAGSGTRYIPSVSGDLDRLTRQIALARDEGIDMVLIAPMIVGLPALHAVRRRFPQMALVAHPALAGAGRIAPPLLLGKLFRLFGADATVFPNHGGRFGYSPATCRALARAALAPWDDFAPCLPVPAGGMAIDRVSEMLDFYGPDVMLLIGGGLLAARERLTQHTAAFVRKVHAHEYPATA